MYTIPLLIYFIYPNEIKVLMFPPLYVEYNKNTTSVDYTEGMYSPIQLSNLLNRYTSYKVLCMHHMDMTIFYKACKVGRYLMIEPHIDKLYGKEVSVLEKSTSCNGIVKKKRFECVSVYWKDEYMSFINGSFCNELAMGIQLSIDEFKGNKHCE